MKDNPGCDGVLLGSHGLFTWGNTQRECYLNSIRTIDQMGEFIAEHQAKGDPALRRREAQAGFRSPDDGHAVLPALRGIVSSNRRVIAHFTDHQDALEFANSEWAEQLGGLGTSCPDHFLRTRICPMFIDWNPGEQDVEALKARIAERAVTYRGEYQSYYKDWATEDSPKLRDSNPSVVVIPGLGIFGFGKNKKEARITTEFFINAVHVMAGANALDSGEEPQHPYPQARHAEQSEQFVSFKNYVALPRSEAFRIEYWALEEAKLQRMPPEAEFSRKIVLVVGGGSGIGREVALLLARKGAHIVVADQNVRAAQEVATEAAALSSSENVVHTQVDLSSGTSIAEAGRFTVVAVRRPRLHREYCGDLSGSGT